MRQYHRGCKGPIDSSQKGMFPFMPYMKSFQLQVSKVKSIKRSPVYLFYEVVANGSDGTPGDDGDVYYRCLHGAHKVCMIKRSMRSNLNSVMNEVHRGAEYPAYQSFPMTHALVTRPT